MVLSLRQSSLQKRQSKSQNRHLPSLPALLRTIQHNKPTAHTRLPASRYTSPRAQVRSRYYYYSSHHSRARLPRSPETHHNALTPQNRPLQRCHRQERAPSSSETKSRRKLTRAHFPPKSTRRWSPPLSTTTQRPPPTLPHRLHTRHARNAPSFFFQQPKTATATTPFIMIKDFLVLL